MNFNIYPDLFKKSFKTQWLKCIYIYIYTYSIYITNNTCYCHSYPTPRCPEDRFSIISEVSSVCQRFVVAGTHCILDGRQSATTKLRRSKQDEIGDPQNKTYRQNGWKQIQEVFQPRNTSNFTIFQWKVPCSQLQHCMHSCQVKLHIL